MTSSRIAAAVVVVTLAAGGTAAFAVDVTSDAGPIAQVFTRTSDTPTVINSGGGLNLPVDYNLRSSSMLVVTATFTGIANSERGWGMNCNVFIAGTPSIPCHPFSAVGHFHPDARDTLAFTTVVPNVPSGAGTVNIFLFASCTIACSGTEEMRVTHSAVVVEAAQSLRPRERAG